MEMDVNIDMNREYSALFSKCNLRSFSISSSISSISYHQYMEINNNLSEKVSKEPINSSQLSYAGEVEVGRLVSQSVDKELANNSQYVYNKIPALKKAPKSYGKDKDKQTEGTNLSSSENVLNI